MLIKDRCIKVRPYEDEEDYTVEIEKSLKNLGKARLRTTGKPSQKTHLQSMWK
jgi:hypothetical protein